jgi:hypothetical protein
MSTVEADKHIKIYAGVDTDRAMADLEHYVKSPYAKELGIDSVAIYGNNVDPDLYIYSTPTHYVVRSAR